MTRKQRSRINRENAKLSTGPVTTEGKRISSQHAATHRLTSMNAFLPAEEQDYIEFAANYVREFEPQGAPEAELVDVIIDTQWRLKRIPGIEARLVACLSGEETGANKVIRSLDILSRHELRLRKQVARSIGQLEIMRENHPRSETIKELADKHQQNGFVSQKPQTALHGAADVVEAIANATTPEQANAIIESYLETAPHRNPPLDGPAKDDGAGEQLQRTLRADP